MQNKPCTILRYVVLIWFGAVGGSARAEPLRPNIVVLLADDLGYGELGCQGNPQIPTPHIDSIASHGIRFTDGYVTAPYCSASRAGLLTGRYQSRFGYEFNPIGAQNHDPAAGLPASEVTLGRHLHDAGYTTALIGKWHLGATAKYHPLRRGFDEFFGFLHEGHYYAPPPYGDVTTMLRRKTLPGGSRGRWVREDHRLIYSTHMGYDEPAYDANNPILRAGQPVQETAYLTDAWTREAVEFIGRNQSKPFFLYVAYNAVHSPLQAAGSYMRRFSHVEDIQRRIFAGMLSNLDDSVGAILEKLRDTGLLQDTLVFFVSDNGGPTRELTSSNLPLRGGKGDVYEGGIRVPFLLQWEGRLPAGEVSHMPIISLDIFATAAAVAGAAIFPDKLAVDGLNLIPYLDGEIEWSRHPPHEELFWRANRRTAIRVGNWKLLQNPIPGAPSRWELYHLGEDASERRDLALQEPEKLRKMKSVWNRLNSEMIDPVWKPER